MQRRPTPPTRVRTSRKSQYVRSGVPGHETPGGRRKSNLPKIIRTAVFVVLIILAIAALIVGIRSLFGRSSGPVKINARPTDNLQPFGERALYYDGVTLHCVSASGSIDWSYSLGTGGDFKTHGTLVAAWAGTQVVVLNERGQPTYTDRMDEAIRFARAGENFIAINFGADLTSKLRVLGKDGTLLENFTTQFEGLYLLDAGFFYNKEQLMWVLGLDIAGNTPITNLSTYEPGRMSTGAVELQDELVYRVYPHGNDLMVADTTTIRTYNYKCVEQTDLASMLIYGWQVKQVRTVNNRTTYTLLEHMPDSGDQPEFSEVRLATNYQVQSLRLLTPCFASGLSEKGVYGFSRNVIYYAPYGTNTFKATSLGFDVTGFLCMLDGGRAVLASGNDVFIMKLPT